MPAIEIRYGQVSHHPGLTKASVNVKYEDVVFPRRIAGSFCLENFT